MDSLNSHRPTLTPLNYQNLLSMAKAFCWCSLNEHLIFLEFMFVQNLPYYIKYLICVRLLPRYFIFKTVADALVPVMADMNIKVLVNLKLQPRRHSNTLRFTSIHLMYLMIHFLCIKLKKNDSICIFFSNLTFIHFLPVLQLQTN